MPCYYIPKLPNQKGEFSFGGSEYHHLVNVRRIQPGNEVLLTNGKGIIATFIVKEIESKQVIGRIKKIRELAPAKPAIAASFSLLKNKNDELIVEKLTELGIREFFPITTARTIRKVGKNTTEKFKKTAITAIKQCDNAYLPYIHSIGKFPQVLNKIKENGYIPLVALEQGRHLLLENIVQRHPEQNYCLVFGPEGGFSPAEIEILQNWNIQLFSLGNHILRAETAAITAAAQILNFYLKQNPEYY
ncbi:MAG TPA: hypothetical protein DHM37_08290 [Candidatus Cloacimonas sp.]|jgi:16S rRNA (uracil1498-N3)-methyltransferase|nr:rRNA (uracil1498-N3)-methyltransferase [Candidatus Cloacimonadota bacterium]HCX73703.1 hypothetical protein [Candidatus Cloacimonas sp.]